MSGDEVGSDGAAAGAGSDGLLAESGGRVASLETIKGVLLQPASFPNSAKLKAKLKGGKSNKGPRGRAKGGKKGRAGGGGGGKAAADDEGAKGPGDEVETFAWEGHERVLFVIFPNRVSLRRGLARLSVFLEDPSHSGQVVAPDGVRPGKYAAASYTGHNFRPEDLLRFAQAVHDDPGAILEPEEEALLAILSSRVPGFDHANPLSPAAAGDTDVNGEAEGEGTCLQQLQSGWGCIATARGLNGSEVASTLLHESMHGLFYAYEPLRKASWSFWEDVCGEEDRALWKDFLSSLGYDSENEELCVNEMLAYLSTERELLARNAVKPSAGANASASAATRLRKLQDDFVSFVATQPTLPNLPTLPGQFCAFTQAKS